MNKELNAKLEFFSKNIDRLDEAELKDVLFDLEIKYSIFDENNFTDNMLKEMFDICVGARNHKSLAFNLYSNIWNNISSSDETKWQMLFDFTRDYFYLFDGSMTGRLMAEFIGRHRSAKSLEVIEIWMSKMDSENSSNVSVAIQEIINGYNGVDEPLPEDDIYRKAIELKQNL